MALCAGWAAAQTASPSRQPVHTATGTVLSVDRDLRKLTVDASPVPELKLPALALSFFVSNRAMLDKVRVGQNVRVEFIEQGRNFALTRIAPLQNKPNARSGNDSSGY